jgi:hypothetical protein
VDPAFWGEALRQRWVGISRDSPFDDERVKQAR